MRLTPVHALGRLALASMLVLPAACATDSEKITAINGLNHGFRIEYEKILAQKGTRLFTATRAESFVAMRVTLAQLGMQTEQQDMTLGHLAVAGAAPLPLTDEEWRSAAQIDLPLLRRLIEPYVGAAANFVQFEPQGLDVVINAAFLDAPDGTEVSLTVRLRERAPPRSGWPRREYVGPRTVTVGLEKIFATFERELKAGPQR